MPASVVRKKHSNVKSPEPSPFCPRSRGSFSIQTPPFLLESLPAYGQYIADADACVVFEIGSSTSSRSLSPVKLETTGISSGS